MWRCSVRPLAAAVLCLAVISCLAPRAPAAAASAPRAAHPREPPRTPRAPASPGGWLQLVADYARDNMEYGASGAQWRLPGAGAAPPRAGEAFPQPAILPLLVLPMPVPPQQPARAECPVAMDAPQKEDTSYFINRRNQQGQFARPPDNRFYVAEEEYRPGSTRRAPGPAPASRYATEPEPEPGADAGPAPAFENIASSQRLVELFRAQTPSAPYEPPIKQSAHDGSERAPPPSAAQYEVPAKRAAPAAAPAPAHSAAPPAPPAPRFPRPLLVRGMLTVPRADYSEPYTVWWDADSGSARVDHHGGAATSYRVLAAGRVQRAETHADRSGERPVRRCAVGSAHAAAAPRDRALPALPADLDQFSFAGHVESPRGAAELWQRVVLAREGEAGGARGEALTALHQLLLARERDRVVPLSYTVAVNSSVLGPDCDGYHHEYFEVEEQEHMPSIFNLDLDEACDHVEYVNGSSPEQLARLEPLREFSLPGRDRRYDDALHQFVNEYERRYADGVEEAVRKNVIMQNHRFVSSANREGATVQLGVNFLSDRLDAELAELRGVKPGAEPRRAERFPHARRQLAAAEQALPARFDWRPLGAVSPVRYQGSCMSCWAFAVAGAVEGALFVRTRRLVPLSEKCLVDCAHTHGANGCKGTWPSRAYDYIKDRGLPALDEFTPYEPKVERCASAAPVARISGHVNVTQHSVPALKIAIRRHAPTVVIIDAKAKSFIMHKKGVLYDDRCGKARRQLNHAVLAVGWGERRGEPHFILKNSWSSKWGEGGYIRVQARANTCGVLTMPSYPRLEDEDVLRDLPAPATAPADAQDAVRRDRDSPYDDF